MQPILHNSCETPIVGNCTAESHGCSHPNPSILEITRWGWVYPDRSKVSPSQEPFMAGAWRRMQGQVGHTVITRNFSQPHVGCTPIAVGSPQSEMMSYYLKFFGRLFFQWICPATFEPSFIPGAHKKFWPCYVTKLQMWKGTFFCCLQNTLLFLFNGSEHLYLKKRWIIMPHSPSSWHSGFDSSSL